MVAFLKFWKPANGDSSQRRIGRLRPNAIRRLEVLKGWSPFIVASILIFVTGLPSISKYLNFDALKMPMPFLHNAVLKMPPIAPQPTPEDATVNLNFIAIPGTVVFIGGIVAAFLGGAAVRQDAAVVQSHRSCK